MKNVLKELIARGGRIFPCGNDKAPHGKWRVDGDQFTLDRIHRAPKQGLIPDTLGLIVIDVDHGGSIAVEEVKERLGEPLLVHNSSRENRYHMWYRTGDMPAHLKANADWSTAHGSGQTRCSNGYVILYKTGWLLAALHKADDATLNFYALTRMINEAPRERLSVKQVKDILDTTEASGARTKRIQEMLKVKIRAVVQEAYA